jgi:hypothetical protein
LTNIARIKFSIVKKLFQITASDQGGMNEAVLCMRIGTKHVSAAIAGKHSKQLYNLSYYAGTRTDVQQLDAVLKDHPELTRNFDSVQVAYDFQPHVILPADGKEQVNTLQYLKTMHAPDEAPVFLEDRLPEQQLVNSYWVPAGVHDWLKEHFPAAQFLHQHSVHYQVATSQQASGFFIDFRNDEFLLIASRDRKPVLIQVYEYSTPGDVLFYLLKVCTQLGFTQQEVPVFISGLVDRQSGLFHALFQYFAHISFRLPDWQFPPGQHPAHFFTSLNDLTLCGS